MNERAIKELLYKIADDQLIIGHRNSEWTGFGPLLEEDIAFSSTAQDKVGQSHALYAMLHRLAELAVKIKGELRYHTLHANTWIKQLGSATAESITRLQLSLHAAMPYALGMFEPSPYEEALMAEGIFAGEATLKEKWMEKIQS